MSASNGTSRRHVPQPGVNYVYYSVRKDGTKAFEVRHPRDSAGRSRYEVVAGGLKAAKARANEIYAPSAPVVLKVGTTFEQVVRDWRETRVNRARTVETYDRILRVHVEPSRLWRMKVRDVTPLELERFLGGLRRADGKSGDLSSGSQRLVLAVVDVVLQHAVKMQAIGSVPKIDRKRKPKAGDSRRRVLTSDEMDVLISRCRPFPWLGDIVTVAVQQGLRLGETCGLQWEDVLWDAEETGMLHVRRSLGRNRELGPTKGGRARKIDLFPRARKVLLRMHLAAGRPDTGFVFTNTLGGARQLRDVQRAFDKARTRAGLDASHEDGPVVFHSLRHTAASHLANRSGVSLPWVQAFLGHADLTTTMSYVHKIADENMRQEAFAALAAFGS